MGLSGVIAPTHGVEMLLECESCGYQWEYSGKTSDAVKCPKCKYKVKIPAKAEVIESDEDVDPDKEEEKKEVEMPAKAKVVPHDNGENHFDEKEERFMNELEKCEEEGEIREVCLKYDEEEFNALRCRLKEKAKTIRQNLEEYEEVEDFLEESDWKYQEL